MPFRDVLPIYDPPREKSFRAAIAQDLRDVRSKHRLSMDSMAEKIGCSAKTLQNVDRELHDLNPVTLLRIAYEFGEEAISNTRELYLCRHAEPPTLTDKLNALQEQIDTVRRELRA